jgi:hypothetical protein
VNIGDLISHIDTGAFGIIVNKGCFHPSGTTRMYPEYRIYWMSEEDNFMGLIPEEDWYGDCDVEVVSENR